MGRVHADFVERASWLLRLPLETPTVPVHDEATGCTLWLKLDHLLPSGCTKDRMATSIVAHGSPAARSRRRRSSSRRRAGPPRSRSSMVCATLGLAFRAYMPKTVSGERVLMIRRLGGEVVLTPAERGHARCRRRAGARRGRAGARCYAARQFENPRNVFAHQHTTGPELIRQVGVRLHGFVAGVGTGGTLMGVAHALRDFGYDTVVARAMPTADFTAGGRPRDRRRRPGCRRRHEPAHRPGRGRARRAGAGPGARGAGDGPRVRPPWPRRRPVERAQHRGGAAARRPRSAPGTTSRRSCPTAWSATSRPRCSTTWRQSSERAAGRCGCWASSRTPTTRPSAPAARSRGTPTRARRCASSR